MWTETFRTAVGVFDDLLHVFTDIPRLGAHHLKGARAGFQAGNLGPASAALFLVVLHPLTRSLGRCFDAIIRTVRASANLAGWLCRIQPAPRALFRAERERYARAFGRLDLDRIRIQVDRVGELFRVYPHVVGDTIYLPSRCLGVGGRVLDSGLLDHEMAHVWQHQMTGGLYLHRSIWAQFRAALRLGGAQVHGSVRDAYVWEPSALEGVLFTKMNPEQQAEVIRHAIASLDTHDANDPDDSNDTPLVGIGRFASSATPASSCRLNRFVTRVAEDLAAGQLRS